MSHDLAIHYEAAQNQNAVGPLARLIENWQARRSVASLLKLDDHLLRDAGMHRGDVFWAAHLPLSVNASLALEERLSRVSATARPN
jgi:uncharacterized protein YjiS (DUF1127 family)